MLHTRININMSLHNHMQDCSIWMCKCNTTIAAPGEQNILWKLSILVEIERILHPSFIRTTRPLHTPQWVSWSIFTVSPFRIWRTFWQVYYFTACCMTGFLLSCFIWSLDFYSFLVFLPSVSIIWHAFDMWRALAAAKINPGCNASHELISF